jgi:hypothetical protein
MKQACMIFLIPGIFFFANCRDNGAAANEKQLAGTTAKQTTEDLASATTISDNGIVGTWKLTMEAYDDNNNDKLDDEERKSGMKNSTPQALHDYKIQFNSNGTSKIEGRYNSTYKLSEEE